MKKCFRGKEQKKNQEAVALINQLMAQIGNALEDMNKGE